MDIVEVTSYPESDRIRSYYFVLEHNAEYL